MSNNQPPRPPPRRPQPDTRPRPRRRDGRGREGGGEDCSAYSKKVQPTTFGDAFEAKYGKNARSRAQPIRAAIPDNQPGPPGLGPVSNAVVQNSYQERRHEAADSSSPSSSSSSGTQPRAGAHRFTTPREPELTLQHTTSSDSNGRMPSNQSMNGAVSSATNLSYSAVAKSGDKKNRDENKYALLKFLTEFIVDGHACPYYKAELSAMKQRSPKHLTIQFSHMRENNIKLAFETWKSLQKQQDWIKPALQEFLRSHSNLSEAAIMICDLKLSYSPSSMRKVTDVLKTATYPLKLLEGECREARADAKIVIQLFFREVFARHKKDQSWNGDFSVDDMLLVNETELLIMKKSKPTTEPSSKLRDIQKGGEVLLPHFKGAAGYPAYFDELEQDIQEANTSQISKPWFVEYFTFHMASLSPMTRRNFELALSSVSKKVASQIDGIFGRLTSEPDWQAYVEKLGSKVLNDVLHYIDPRSGEMVKYANNIRGLVKYKRNFLEHAVADLFDLNQIELFGANKFPKDLPRTVKLLLKEGKMYECFSGPWTTLRSSSFDDRDTPRQ